MNCVRTYLEAKEHRPPPPWCAGCGIAPRVSPRNISPATCLNPDPQDGQTMDIAKSLSREQAEEGALCPFGRLPQEEERKGRDDGGREQSRNAAGRLKV